MIDNPLANILARLVGERSDVAARAFERAAYDYAMARGCDLGRDAEAYARLRVVTSAVRGGDYNEAWMRGALDALRDAIYSSRSREEELRRRVDVALRTAPSVTLRPTYDSAEVFVEGRRVNAMGGSIEGISFAPANAEAQTVEPFVGGFASGPVRAVLTINSAADINAAFGEGSEIANAFRYASEIGEPRMIRRGDIVYVGDEAMGLAVDDSDIINGTVSVMMGQPMTNVSGTVRQYVNGEWRELRPMTATQQREADARAEWRRRTIENMDAYAWKLCGACGRLTRRSTLCFQCRDDAPTALSRWRERISQRQRHAAPVPLDAPGGVCASRLYPEAPRAHDAVRLRCPLRRSPDRVVTLCVEQPTTNCVTPMRSGA